MRHSNREQHLKRAPDTGHKQIERQKAHDKSNRKREREGDASSQPLENKQREVVEQLWQEQQDQKHDQDHGEGDPPSSSRQKRKKIEKKRKFSESSLASNAQGEDNPKSLPDGIRMNGEKFAMGKQRTYPIVLEPKETGTLRGLKKWLADYHSKRPGLDILQQQIDAFIADYEAREEQARREREAAAAEEGWTVVLPHKGRKKTTDLDSGIKVGGVASAVVERNVKKKGKEAALNFYRFQRREARRNEVLELQRRFEEDKKKIAKMKAARKFRPF